MNFFVSRRLQSVSQLSEVSNPAASRAPPHSPGTCAQVPVARHHGGCVYEAHQQRGKLQTQNLNTRSNLYELLHILAIVECLYWDICSANISNLDICATFRQ